MQKSRTPTIHDPRYRSLVERLITIRTEANIFQAEIAHKMGLAQPDISKIERFERRIDILDLRDYLSSIYNDKKLIEQSLIQLLK